MELAERILLALEVLGSDESVLGKPLADQAAHYLGAEVNTQAFRYMEATAYEVFKRILKGIDALAKQPTRQVAFEVALGQVFMAGAAVGKRLGIEDGEAFAKAIGGLDEPDA